MNTKTQISRLLRKDQTRAEAKLWRHLRNGGFENLKFRRQYPIKNYIVDFVNIKYQIVLELILSSSKRSIKTSSSVKEIPNRSIMDSEEPLTLALSSRRGNSSGTVLASKKLLQSQKELLLNAGIGLVEYDAIKIELLDISGIRSIQKNAIFTSKNAVRSIQNSEFRIQNCFCVGSNTKKLLEENGYKVAEIAQNASDLAEIIIKKYKTESFSFFCGNLRRNELPELLSQHKVHFTEHIVYNTHLNTRKFDRSFDGILFFSPSAVQSYVTENAMGDSIAFCIGNTTASEAKKYTKKVIVANKPTVENVIVRAVKYYKNDLSSQT
ncbi:uroporphyrinogen-III synthase [Aquimarina sp. U1-2]|uniref:uroporphyrinogen-III synthase n=1 Tax=Aquimarina sp. U1-2 TaxID=2823141 RepID=UPI001AEC7E07|nr:uroporphyrinogen-III synthase [Aquimarina sp. U1-2]MBP2834162.1 uroporphyrinogen-III synthase [Aquimarina sp. U1-2]